MNPLQRWLIRGIEGYQRRGGGRSVFGIECNFTPSCSEYTRQAIHRFGALRGLRLGWGRVCRCADRDAVGRISDPLTSRGPVPPPGPSSGRAA